MNNNEIKIINGSYEFTQIYLLYQLLNELSTGNNHNQNIVDVLIELLNKEYPTTDLSGIISSINQINSTLNNNDSNVVNAINNINIPEVDLTNVIDAINSLKSNLNNEDINININENVYCYLKPIVEVINEPIENRNIKITKSITKIIVPPTIIKIVNKEAYLRICGSPSPDSKYINCINCVDAWLKDNPNPHLSQVTRKGTGCRVK
jgi:hypothetical protein